MSDKQYLGDGVYVEAEKPLVKLTTEDGRRATNTILLEPEVLVSLLRWVHKKYPGALANIARQK